MEEVERPELLTLTVPDAIQEMLSKLSSHERDQVWTALNVSKSSTRYKWMEIDPNTGSAYIKFPAELVPALCRLTGSSLLLDVLIAQTQVSPGIAGTPVGPWQAMKEIEDVARKFIEMVEDGVVTADEKRAWFYEMREAVRAVRNLDMPRAHRHCRTLREASERECVKITRRHRRHGDQ